MTLSVRLDDETKRLLSRLARAQNTSRSEIVRKAIHALAKNEAANEDLSLYDRLKDIIGSVHGGPRDLSENTGEKFRRILLEKKRKGRL